MKKLKLRKTTADASESRFLSEDGEGTINPRPLRAGGVAVKLCAVFCLRGGWVGEQKPRTAWSAEPAHPPLSQTAGVQESRGVCGQVGHATQVGFR